MEETTEATFYQDEGISSHLMPHYLYDKNELHLNLHPVAEDPKLGELKRNATPSELRSPDFGLLKLASPELEKMIMSLQSGVSTSPIPSSLFGSHAPLNPSSDSYTRGFTEALQDLHDKQTTGETSTLIDLADSSAAGDPFLGQTTGNGSFLTTNQAPVIKTSVESIVYSNNPTRNEPSDYFVNTGNIYSNPRGGALFNPYSTAGVISGYPTVYSYPPDGGQLAQFQDYGSDTTLRGFSPYGNVLTHQKQDLASAFKIEPQITTDSGVLQPIDLEIQEVVKRERKKQRNRVASSKCRKRKLEREGRLEGKVKDLKERNIELNAVANALKQQVCDLKQRVMDHVGEGCQIMLAHQSRMSTS